MRLPKIYSWMLIAICGIQLCLPSHLFGQAAGVLPYAPQTITLGLYRPVNLAGLTLSSRNPLQMEFIVDSGDDRVQGDDLQAESQKLINYFFAVLTTPEKELWVNLSPTEKDRIMAEALSRTEIGRDMLAQDLKLKQLTARLTNPETELGKKYWQQLNATPSKNLAGKVWIVPQNATVYVHGQHVFVTKCRLKVLMEQEFLKANHSSLTPSESEGIFKNLILPQIEKEVNEGKDFANLRQIYNAMILATWYKRKLKGSLLEAAYIDKNKMKGIDGVDRTIKDQLYDQYLSAFRQGAYSTIQEDVDEVSGESVPKKYFSGGVTAVTAIEESNQPPTDWIREYGPGRFFEVGVNSVLQASSTVNQEFTIPPQVSRANYSGRYAFAVKWLMEPKSYFDVSKLKSGAVIDVGTSYGYGAFEIAKALTEKNPALKVYGVDPGQHVGDIRHSTVLPENLTFIQDDHRLLKAMAPAGPIQESVQVITMFNVHFWYPKIQQRQQVFRDLLARLDEGGIFIIGSGPDRLARNISFMVYQKKDGQLVPQEILMNTFNLVEGMFANLLFHYSLSLDDQKRVSAELALWIDELNQKAEDFKLSLDYAQIRLHTVLELERDFFAMQVECLQGRGIPIEKTSFGLARIPIAPFLQKVRELYPQVPKDPAASSSVQEVRAQIEQLQSQLGELRKPSQEQMDALLAKLDSGENTLSGEIVDVYDQATENSKIIGQIDRRVASNLGYVVQTAEAFVLAPNGKLLFPLRVPLSKETVYPYHLGIYGGYVESGESHLKAVTRELVEELGLTRLVRAPEFLGYDVYDKPWDTVRQRKARYFYRLSEYEYRRIRKQNADLSVIKNLQTEEAVIQHLRDMNQKSPGAGEAFGVIEMTIEELMGAHQERNPQSKNIDKGQQNRFIARMDPVLSRSNHQPFRMFFTPDNLDLAVENEGIMQRLNNAITYRQLKGIAVDPTSGRIHYRGDPNIQLKNIELWVVRHGETLTNTPRDISENLFSGTKDEDRNQLTPQGRQQAQKAAEELYAKLESKLRAGQEVVVVMSPLRQARDTAWAFLDRVAQKFNMPSFTHIAGNREVTYQLPQSQGGGMIHVLIDDRLKEVEFGESFLSVIKRTFEALREYKERFTAKTVILFGHATNLAAIRVNLQDQELLDNQSRTYIDWRGHELVNAKPTLINSNPNVRTVTFGSSPLESEPFTKGGIDLDAKDLDLQEEGDFNLVDFSFEQLKQIPPEDIEGIVPVITNMTPVSNFPQLIGFKS